MILSIDRPYNQPSFKLETEVVATVLNILVLGARATKPKVRPNMLEVPIANRLFLEMRNIQREKGIDNIRIDRETSAWDDFSSDPHPTGRLDIRVIFREYFYPDSNYFTIECKRIGYKKSSLISYYVDHGVEKFIAGTYGNGHEWGCMAGFIVAGPKPNCIKQLEDFMRRRYGEVGRFSFVTEFEAGADIRKTIHLQHKSKAEIKLLHAFFDFFSPEATI